MSKNGNRTLSIKILTEPPERSTLSRLLQRAVFVCLSTVLVFLASSFYDKTASSFSSGLDFDRLYNEPSQEFCDQAVGLPLVCGHGGEKEAGPPNTIASLLAALDSGARCVEMDVSMTKDGHLVALHPRDLAALLQHNRSFSIEGRSKDDMKPTAVEAYSLEELRIMSRPFKSSHTSVSSLSDALSAVLNHSQGLEKIILDIKLMSQPHSAHEAAEAKMAVTLARTLEKLQCGTKCLIWSKSDDMVRKFAGLNVASIGIVAKNETEEDRASQLHLPMRLPSLKISAVGLHYEMASAAFIASIQENRSVYAWTADTAAIMGTVLDAAPYGVVTSYPRRAMEVVRARRIVCEKGVRRSGPQHPDEL